MERLRAPPDIDPNCDYDDDDDEDDNDGDRHGGDENEDDDEDDDDNNNDDGGVDDSDHHHHHVVVGLDAVRKEDNYAGESNGKRRIVERKGGGHVASCV